MRIAVLLAVLTGCGRVEFDHTPANETDGRVGEALDAARDGSTDASDADVSDPRCRAPENRERAPFALGDGTANMPYLVCTAAQLDAVRTAPASEFELGDAIDLAALGAPWVPIPQLTGRFDGRGHAIRGLSQPAAPGGYAWVLELRGTLENVVLTDVDIRGTTAGIAALVRSNDGSIVGCHVHGAVAGADDVGMIAAFNNAGRRIEDCTADMRLEGANRVGAIARNWGTLRSISVRGSVRGTYTVGGLVGLDDRGVIDRCDSSAAVFASTLGAGIAASVFATTITDTSSSGDATCDQDCGGAVGYAGGDATLQRVRSSSTVVAHNFTAGGLIAFAEGARLIEASSTGHVSGSGQLGGLIGRVSADGATVDRCWSRATLVGEGALGGLIGVVRVTRASRVTDSYAAVTMTADYAAGGLIGDVVAGPLQIERSHAAGPVGASSQSGGVFGRVLGGAPSASAAYWSVPGTGQSADPVVPAACGLTAGQMQSEASFAGWDFASVWRLAGPYPTLRWEAP